MIAPDLIGHGDSATPRGDYSLGAHAAGIRDLLAAIGVDSATIVGHSLGGGVAMQFFYQFPQRTERLVLVSSGGLGHEVSPLLRGAALPGASALLALAAHRSVSARSWPPASGCARGLEQGGVPPGDRACAAAARKPGAREAFLQTLRSVIDVRGQRVSALDRLYLLETRCPPWSSGASATTRSRSRTGADARGGPGQPLRDPPARRALPHLEDPEGLAAVLRDFLETTSPRGSTTPTGAG